MAPAGFLRDAAPRALAQSWAQRSLSLRQRKKIQEVLPELSLRLLVRRCPSLGAWRTEHSGPLAAHLGKMLRCSVLRTILCTDAHLSQDGSPMRTTIEIEDTLMAEAQKACGHATKKETVEQALRLMIRLWRQQEVGAAFGKYRWRGNLARSRRG